MVTRERRLTVTLVAVLVAVVVVGLGAAFAIGRTQRVGGAEASGATGGTGVSGETGTPDRTTTQTPDRPTTASTGTSTGTSTRATVPQDTAGPPSPVEVTLSAEAQSSSHAAEVETLLQRYFDAINAHDYQAWKQTVTPAQSAHWAKDDWESAYSSTVDSDIYVSDINEGAVMSVRIQFVSHQDVDLAPTSLPVTCVNWDVLYRLEIVDGGLRVGTSVRDPYLVACR